MTRGVVYQINLHDNGVKGTIPSEMGLLSDLREFSFICIIFVSILSDNPFCVPHNACF